MAEIKFSKDEREIIVKKVQRYFEDELEQEVGSFEASFLIDFFAKEIGSYYYNRGLFDARAILEQRLEVITDAIYDLEKPTDYRR